MTHPDLTGRRRRAQRRRDRAFDVALDNGRHPVASYMRDGVLFTVLTQVVMIPARAISRLLG